MLTRSRVARPVAALSVVALSFVGALTSCGSDTAPLQTVDEACRAAADVFAAAPGPGDTPETHAAFLAAATQAVGAATYPIRDRAAASDDWRLKELSSLIDRFPQLIGAWTIEEVAWRSRASVVRIAEVAAELGEPSCSTETFRLADWVTLSEQLTPPVADDATYVDQLAAVCAATVAGLTSSTTPGAVGDAMSWVMAQGSLRDLTRGAQDLVPSVGLVDRHVDLLAAMQSVEALLPDVGSEIADERLARFDDSLGRMDTTLVAMGISC